MTVSGVSPDENALVDHRHFRWQAMIALKWTILKWILTKTATAGPTHNLMPGSEPLDYSQSQILVSALLYSEAGQSQIKPIFEVQVVEK